MSELLKAASWLRKRAIEDEDIKLALHAAYRKFGVTQINQLPDDFVLDLYESMIEADLDMELMTEADTDARDRMARVKWKSG